MLYFPCLLHLVLVCFILGEEVELPVSNVFMLHPNEGALLFRQMGWFDPCRLFRDCGSFGSGGPGSKAEPAVQPPCRPSVT